MKAELKKFLEHIANNVGEVITEYHWREACELLKELDKTKKYYLGNLNKDQRGILYDYLLSVDETYSGLSRNEFKKFSKDYIVFDGNSWDWLEEDRIDALELFETQLKQGDKVLVRDYEVQEWIEKVYVVEYKGDHYVKSDYESCLISFKFIKPYEEKRKWYKSISPLNNISYDLIDPAEKLGLTESGFVVLEITDKEFINQLENN